MIMMRKVLNGISVVLTVVTVILGAFFIFTSFWDLSLYRVPIILNTISLLVAARFVFMIITIVVPIFDFLKKWVRIFAVVLTVFLVLLCFMFGYSAYSGYVSFSRFSDTGYLGPGQTVSEQTQILLPYNEYIGDGEETFYSVIKESTKQCTQITVSNKQSTGEESEPSYSVYYFRSKNMALLLKFYLEEYFGDFMKADFERTDPDDYIEEKMRIKCYTNFDGYSAVAVTWRYICYFRLADIDKSEISIDDFYENVHNQIPLINDFSELENG